MMYIVRQNVSISLEDGGTKFLWNVSNFLPAFMICYENLKCQIDVVPAFTKIRIIIIETKLMSRKDRFYLVIAIISFIYSVDVNTYSTGCFLIFLCCPVFELFRLYWLNIEYLYFFGQLCLQGVWKLRIWLIIS